MNRKNIIEVIEEMTNTESDRIGWVKICEFTEFDSVITALAYGLTWNVNHGEFTSINDKDTKTLKSILYNLTAFPREPSKEY